MKFMVSVRSAKASMGTMARDLARMARVCAAKTQRCSTGTMGIGSNGATPSFSAYLRLRSARAPKILANDAAPCLLLALGFGNVTAPGARQVLKVVVWCAPRCAVGVTLR